MPDIHLFLRQLTLVFEVKARRHHADVALEVQQELVGCGVEEGRGCGPCDRWQGHTAVQVDRRNLLSETLRGDILLSAFSRRFSTRQTWCQASTFKHLKCSGLKTADCLVRVASIPDDIILHLSKTPQVIHIDEQRTRK